MPPAPTMVSSIWKFCNTFAVTILACCVVWIFFQLQYVWYTLNQESDRIDTLLKEIQSQQTQQIDELNQKVCMKTPLLLLNFALIVVLGLGFQKIVFSIFAHSSVTAIFLKFCSPLGRSKPFLDLGPNGGDLHLVGLSADRLPHVSAFEKL